MTGACGEGTLVVKGASGQGLARGSAACEAGLRALSNQLMPTAQPIRALPGHLDTASRRLRSPAGPLAGASCTPPPHSLPAGRR